MKIHVDQPIFWIQKLDKSGQPKELHDALIDLLQRIEKGSFLEQELVECLMKWYGMQKSWHQMSLSGVTILHISAACGVKSIVEFIVSYNDNPNTRKGNGATPIYSAAFRGNVEIVKFLASKVEEPNLPKNDGCTPIYATSANGHIDIVKFLASKVDDPNKPRKDGCTPIFIASLIGHIDSQIYCI